MANKEQQLRYKGYRCAGCGMSVSEMVERYGSFKRITQFHHIDPTSKAADYTNLIRRKISTKQLDELDKCVLLCDRCHNVLHSQNARGNITISIEVCDRTVRQSFVGWFNIDFKDRIVTFLTNQRSMLTPYYVSINGAHPIVLCGVEIEEQNVLVEWFRKSQPNDTILIVNSENSDLIFSVTRRADNLVHIEQNINSPFFRYEMMENKGDEPYLWVREGMMLHNDGTLHTSGTLKATVELLPEYTEPRNMQ